MYENLKSLRDKLQARHDASAKVDAIDAEAKAVAKKRLTQDERDELIYDIDRRRERARKELDVADREVTDCVLIYSTDELLAELKALNLS